MEDETAPSILRGYSFELEITVVNIALWIREGLCGYKVVKDE